MMTNKPIRVGEDSYMKFIACWNSYSDDWLVVSKDTVIEKNLSEDAAQKLCQFLNAAEYLNEDPRQRAKRPERINFDFDAIYEKYPKKQGKKLGIERLKRSVNTPDKYELLMQAVENYAQEMQGTEEKFIKHFSTWASQWTDSIPNDATTSSQQTEMSLDDITKLMV